MTLKPVSKWDWQLLEVPMLKYEGGDNYFQLVGYLFSGYKYKYLTNTKTVYSGDLGVVGEFCLSRANRKPWNCVIKCLNIHLDGFKYLLHDKGTDSPISISI